MTKNETAVQKVGITEIPKGKILDIGGGGEGIIAQIGRKNVTAIDLRADEIEEAKGKAPEAEWLIADASNLPFAEGTFDSVTAFFSLMYMRDPELKAKVFLEAARVLRGGGEFWIWDTEIDGTGDVFILHLEVSLPGGEKISTGYGVRADFEQSSVQTAELLACSGFELIKEELGEYCYHIRARKL